MGVQQGQCLLGVVPGKVFLPIRQIGLRQVVVRVSRIQIREKIELEGIWPLERLAWREAGWLAVKRWEVSSAGSWEYA